MIMRHRVAAVSGLLLWLSCAFWTGLALAEQQPVEAVLALRVQPGIVPEEPLRLALQAELGVQVTGEGSPRDLPTLTVQRVASGNVEVALASRTLPRASRELLLSAELESERVEMVALIAANLVRNEAASLLPDLRPAPAPGASSKVAEEPPAARLRRPCREPRGVSSFGFDFAPGVGSSSSEQGRTSTRHVSLGLVGTLSGRVRGFEGSIAVNIDRFSVCGVQAAAGANVSLGPVQGAQLGNFNLAVGGVIGVQSASVNVSGADLLGVQGGALNITRGNVTGLQGAVANYAGGDLLGLQGGVLNVSLGGVRGAQGGVANYAGGDLVGAQAGVLNLDLGHVTGAQIGVGNFARDGARGAQAGVVNISAGNVRGAQVGVFNYTERSTVSLGVFSVVRRGRTSIDASYAIDNGMFMVGVSHGGKLVHNLLGVGARTGKEGTRLATLWGLGFRVLSTERLRLDLDLTHVSLLHQRWRTYNTDIAGVRAPLTVMLARGLGVMVAPSFNVMITNDRTDVPQSIFPETTLHRDQAERRKDDRIVYGYPGVTVGLRYEFDHSQ